MIDAVLYTHEHADHTHGIDELRAFYIMRRKRMPVWADEVTGTLLTSRFNYCFYTAPGSDYPPILDLNRLVAGTPVEIAGAGGTIKALPFEVEHGNIHALGFRIGNIAYTPDINGVPEAQPGGARKGSTCGSSMPCAATRIRAISASPRRWNGSRG